MFINVESFHRFIIHNVGCFMPFSDHLNGDAIKNSRFLNLVKTRLAFYVLY